ncbi:Tetratricopeptide repeat,Tetratricopeptide repeat-containing domain,Tetratricopeptide-like helical [Cinara cedri]|uniref:Tetratricopeptide repeat,Tetratricopeptide repeat-containing domain,Tetratricopeptide-like helical n=1 Tax=Cinara cedri TaxID=506608 RepID=A0A5E4MFC2_9HEMI|nr:Tetratricopeptide repeat,Tetratricopeptide repeat-containing domain,Tetratricopeptide-like helical [Cinara cedri]
MSDSSGSSFVFLSNWKLGLAVSVPCFAVGLCVTFYNYFKTSGNTRLLDKPTANASIAKEANVENPPETNGIDQTAFKTKTLVEKVEDLKKLGNAEFLKRNYDMAITYYTQAILMCPESKQAALSVLFQNRAAAYSKLNNNENCLADCNNALALVPRYVKALSRRARVLSELGNLKLALEDITAATIFDDYKNQDDVIFSDNLLKSLGEQNLEEYTKHNAFNLPSKTFINQFLKSFCDDPFSDEFTMALLKSDINTGLEYALKCIQNQKFEEIEKACQEELNKADNSLIRESFALNLLATFYLLRGNYAAGIEHLTTVIENPNVPNKLIINSLIKRALIYHQQEEVDKSFEDFNRAEVIDPNSSAVYHHRAQIYLRGMNTKKAVKDLKKSLELNSNFDLSIIYYYFAQYCHAKRVSNANVKHFLIQLGDFVINYPDIPESFTLYTQALLENGAYRGADLVLKNALEIHPDQADFLVHRALIASSWKINGIFVAFRFIEQALNLDPKCNFAYETLGALYMRVGQQKDAIDCLEKAIPLPKSRKQLLYTFSLRNLAQTQLAIVERFRIMMPNGYTISENQ